MTKINFKNLFLTILLISLSIAGFSQVPVFIYHAHPNFGFLQSDFAQQMDFLVNNDYQTATMDQLYDWMVNDQPLPYRPVVLTFDDNYIRVYTEVYPVLAARGLTAVNYAHSSYVGVGGSNDHCDWIEICEMESNGAVLTESHTKTHANLAAVSLVTAQEEIEGSKSDIETNISGKTCNHIAYPYGGYNSDVIDLCSDAGYLTAVTTENNYVYRDTPLFQLGRLGGDGISLTSFKTKCKFYDLPSNPPETGWVIDNGEANFKIYGTGTFNADTQTGYYGDDYCIINPGDGQNSARWAAYLKESGSFRIWARWTAHQNRTSQAEYVIHHSSGQSSVTVDQTQNGSEWRKLGTFYFDEGDPVMVYLHDSTDGYAVADGVWFEPVESLVKGWQLY